MKLKKLLPRSLFGRFLLIIAIPTLIVQVVTTYVFFYVYVDSISKHMARSVVSEMAFVKSSVGNVERQALLHDFSTNIELSFSFEERRKFKKKSKIADSDWKRSKIYQYFNLFPLIDPLNRFKSELENRNLTPYEIYENPEDGNSFIVKVQTNSGLLSFDVPVKRITSSSKYVFILWILTTAVITSFISIIFLKNQLRPISLLSKAAEKFGRGQDVPNFRPSGSREIRSVAISFIKMKERIVRQISQRTDMLSAVSHDLRTPLTRMKLQLEMTKNSDDVAELQQDINDMEKLIGEYLDFARHEEREKAKPTILHEFLEKITNYYVRLNKEIETRINVPADFEMLLKKLALKRALINLIDNAFNYGDKVIFSASLSQNNLMILIDDNGPGIPENERHNVFKPFYRINNSYNLDKSQKASAGSGLGLAIAMDAVTSHGGRMRLGDSALGGLRVLIHIPI
ncbi:MAG: HAMP domain-containing protein [Rickettsiales bacterium]|nr:HAMP domain-containing protein [Rickettsiales bacterium]